MQALVTPSQEVYTAVSCFSKMPTCTATYAQDTQASSHDQLQTKLPPVPDLENRRYCRACQIMLPVSAFPSGKRRYLCKRHIWERVQRPSKQRALAKADKRRLWTLWKTCWCDAKRTFKHKRILLLQRDIEQTLAQIEDSSHGSEPARSESDRNAAPSNEQPALPRDKADTNTEQTTVHRNEADTNTEQPTVHRNEADTNTEQPAVHHEEACNDAADSELRIALMPLNPEHQLSRDNVVVVDRTARRVLLQAFRQGGADKYISELGALDLTSS